MKVELQDWTPMEAEILFFWDFTNGKWGSCGAPVDESVQLGFITSISLWFMVPITSYNYSIHGVYKPSNITGGAHIVGIM